jgi:alpha-beta hydrolase superfamily lysophospholipase
MRLKGTIPIEGRDGSRRLVVLVHGWAMWPFITLRDVEVAIRDALPDADVLAPRYPAHFSSNADPVEVAEALSREVQYAVDARREAGQGYEELVLVGFSSGALLIRKAYVFARGQVQDGSTVAAIATRDWPTLVGRIVLLAGTSRGWSLDPKPRHMSQTLHALFRLLLATARTFRFGRYVRAIERGSPFVANLRLQWLALDQGGEPPPLTVQLLGDRDDMVDAEDNIDIQVSARFAFLPVDETGHAGILNFRQAGVGPRRRAAFVRALTAPDAELRRTGPALPGADREHKADVRLTVHQPAGGPLRPPEVDVGVTDVIFVMHGIRDYGQWTTRLREAVEGVVASHNAGAAEPDRRKVVVVTSRHGRFPLSGFLMTAARRAKVRWFADLYTQIAARYPKARRHFIGHSNGTYLLAGALRESTPRFGSTASPSPAASCRVTFPGTTRSRTSGSRPCAMTWPRRILSSQRSPASSSSSATPPGCRSRTLAAAVSPGSSSTRGTGTRSPTSRAATAQRSSRAITAHSSASCWGSTPGRSSTGTRF